MSQGTAALVASNYPPWQQASLPVPVPHQQTDQSGGAQDTSPASKLLDAVKKERDVQVH